MVSLSLGSYFHTKLRSSWTKLSRSSWTAPMITTHEYCLAKSSISNMETILVFTLLCRTLLLIFIIIDTGHFPYTEVTDFITLIFGYLLVKRRKLTRFLRYVFPLLTYAMLPAFTYQATKSEGDNLGFVCGAIFVVMLVEFQTVVRQIWVELIYTVCQASLVVVIICFYDIPGLHKTPTLILLTITTLGVIFCSISRRMVETEMFEARYKNNDLTALISHLQVGVVVRTKEKLLLTNGTFEALTTVFEDEDTGVDSGDLRSFLKYLETQNAISSLDDVETPRDDDAIIHRGGESYAIRSQTITCLDEDAQLILLQDITETEKAVSELKQLDRFKTNLIRTVSHDYRTPLNVILNGLEMISEYTELPPDLKKFTTLCQQASQFLMYLVNDLLDYYQIKIDAFQVVLKEFNLLDTITTALDLLTLKAQTAGVSLELEYDDSLPKMFMSDPERLHQVLINLVTNAIKYSAEGAVVHLRISRVSKRDALVEIEDHGLGIRDEDLCKLFNEFGRIIDPENLSCNPKGVGLGLWICKQICSEIGSGIEVSSVHGEGSIFSFGLTNSLPEETIDEQFNSIIPLSHHNVPFARDGYYGSITESFLGSVTEGVTPHNQTSGRVLYKWQPSKQHNIDLAEIPEAAEVDILVVDDEAFNQIVLKQLMTSLGVSCDIASSGKEALEIIKEALNNEEAINKPKNPYRLMIVDYDMPWMSGPELIKHIRQLEKELDLPHCIIIGHTAFGKPERTELLDCGADDIMPKPVSSQHLRQFLNTYYH